MSYILNIETSTHICSVSLSKNGQLIELEESHEDKTHAELLTVFIDDVLKRAGIKANELSAVAVCEGPGSYTSLRIGASVAKGICYGLNIPLIAIPSLKSMAYGASQKYPDQLLCPMIDARRMEVYTALYRNTLEIMQETHALVVDETSFSEILKSQKVLFFGTGAEKCKQTITHENATFVNDSFVSSQHMVTLSYESFLNQFFVDTAYFEPFYLKEFIAVKSQKSFF
ncbi:MAG: tRNA (adenosine(37)-N6)-threonylcarbamoyltransferase complex dimerization subunit type 1 TsaB [Bacteroidales bacterium]|nr:tRNA (adenosine(37)-N6)-threonylcarbamoyltransferase complex dimerization subunit type 1 TsaB [Bacteroidales bacterium]